jgi:two-component system, OmpR family, phosphate regulon response regulator PhoB
MSLQAASDRPAEILVVEDEIEIRELISLLLLRQGHRVQQCGSAVEAAGELKKTKFDLMILDWMLPQLSGLDFLKQLDQKNKTPVLMVTAKSEPSDIVQGLEAGADDYVTKPFEPAIFSARVKALLRRAKSQAEAKQNAHSDILKFGEISINTASYEVQVAGEAVHLTPSEYKILLEMGQNQGRVLTRDYLISVVQGEGISVTGRTVDTHVFGLRKKMGGSADIIETIRGVGYRVRTE